jgi:hypothetical protein
MLDRTQNAAREKLRAAIAAKENAATALARSSKAANNAKELVDAAEADVLAHDGLDDDMLAHRTLAIRVWSVAGGSERPSMDLSEELKERSRKRQDANDRFAAATAAHVVLSAERTAALKKFSEADSAARAAADAVMVSDAEAVADELERQQAFVNALRFRLRAFLRIVRPIPGAAERSSASGFVVPTFAPLISSSKLRELADYPREPFSSALINPEGEEMANWQAYRERLIADPNSALDCTGD